MSILLENKVVSAKFDNKEQTMIALILEDKNGSSFQYNLDALDHEHDDYKALINNGWDLERIQKETLAVNQANYTVFRQAMYNEFRDELTRLKRKHAAELGEVLKNKNADSNNGSDNSDVNIIKDILSNNLNQDMLFKTKLYVLEKYTTISKAKKTNIRKAETLIKLISLLGDIEE